VTEWALRVAMDVLQKMGWGEKLSQFTSRQSSSLQPEGCIDEQNLPNHIPFR
jgi:hypothetical protein